MSLPIPVSTILVIGVLLLAIGVNDQPKAKGDLWVKWFFEIAGSALIVVWANVAGVES